MATELIKCDLLIIGAGAIGFSIGIAYLDANPGKKVIVADKENQIDEHGSGRKPELIELPSLASFYSLSDG
jgi:L-2-hydroxyglutarate oxidase LhgO